MTPEFLFRLIVEYIVAVAGVIFLGVCVAFFVFCIVVGFIKEFIL